MSDIDEATQRILDRAQQRRLDLQKNNENLNDSVVRSPGKPSTEMPKTLLGNSPYHANYEGDGSKDRRSRMSALAENLNAFDYQPAGSRPKESYIRGTSPRLSMGETRPTVLFTPGQGRSPVTAKQPSPIKTIIKSPAKPLEKVDEETKRIRFAYPIAQTTIADESHSQSIENDSTLGTFSPRDVVSFADNAEEREKECVDEEEEEEYGAHTFLKKSKKGGQSSANSSKLGSNSANCSLILSPKPFNAASLHNLQHSPVRFDPSSSSPIVTEARINISHTIPLDISVIKSDDGGDVLRGLEKAAGIATGFHSSVSYSPSQITPSTAKHFFAQLPTKSPVRSEGSKKSATSSPVRSAAISSAKATSIRKELEAKLQSGEAQMPRPAVSSAVTPSVGGALRTQWRGAAGTPVVTGADPSLPSKPDVRAASMQSLRSRWEFSSATGTPLHPDKKENELISTAKKMAEQRERERILPSGRRDRSLTATSDTSRASLTSSPVAKSPRHVGPRQEPERAEDDDEEMIETEDEEEEDAEYDGEASRIIDQAFHFMDARSPSKSKMPPLATPEREVEGEEEEQRKREAAREKERRERKERARSEEREQNEREERERAERERQQPVFTAPPPPPLEEEPEEEEEIAGSGLVHSVSFYRKRRLDKGANQHEKIDFRAPMEGVVGSSGQVIGSRQVEQKSINLEEEEARLRQSITVQQEQIAQASRALSFCRQTQFRGSREEVDAQRAFLIATESRRCLMKALEDLRNGVRHADGPRGAMTISGITVQLRGDFGGTLGYSSNDGSLYYFLVLLKYGPHVQHTSLMSSDDAVRRKGALEFPQYLRLEQLPPDFCCHLEVYSLRTGREHLAHEEKYKLKAGSSSTMKKKGGAAAGGSHGSGLPLVGDSAFQLAGRLTLDMTSCDRRKYNLVEALNPLEGTLSMRIKRYAMEKGDVLHRGFLSLYQRTPEGLGSWTRYWCVVENGEMRFWRCPEDEATKEWLVLIDLSTCATDGVKPESQELCPFPNSLHVDVWVPKDGGQPSKNMEKLRVLMAADRKEDLAVWLDILNKTIRNLLLWSASPRGNVSA